MRVPGPRLLERIRGGAVTDIVDIGCAGALDPSLRRGDLVLFYTDGLTAARDTDGTMLGFEGLGRVGLDGRHAEQVVREAARDRGGRLPVPHLVGGFVVHVAIERDFYAVAKGVAKRLELAGFEFRRLLCIGVTAVVLTDFEKARC